MSEVPARAEFGDEVAAPGATTGTARAWLALAFAAVALGLSAIFVRLAAVPGAANAFYRMGIATALLAVPALREAGRLPRLPRRHVALAVLAGLLFACDLTAWTTGVMVGSATNATLLANTAPIWVALGATLLFRERLRPTFWLGLVVAITGVAVVVGADVLARPHLATGDLLGLVAGFFYGSFFLPSQKARERLPVLFAWWVAAAASTVCLLIAALVLGQPLSGYPPRSWLWLAAVALVTQVGGYLSISYALGRLPASLVSPVLLVQPVLTALFAVPLLGEDLTALQVLGGLVVLVGIAAVRRSHRS